MSSSGTSQCVVSADGDWESNYVSKEVGNGDLEVCTTATSLTQGGEALEPISNGHTSPSQIMIDRVILENFKSYGGRHVIGPFHHKFSSIVGPNGSGKSNIIDAMLFVFGRRAQKLRHKKLSGLIHKSAEYPNLTFARVAVYFRKAWAPMKESEYDADAFVIAREAYLDGSSRYTINGAASTQKEVTTLLRGHGVDLDHDRFLILQGEVEQISMMKPKGQTPQEEGLLEYLEDIIGSNQYVDRIEAAKETLNEIAEKVQERRDKVTASQSLVNSMKGSLALAESLCLAEKRVLELKMQLEHKASLSLNRQLNRIQTAHDEVNEEWKSWKQSREKEKQEMREIEESLKKQSAIVAKAEKLFKTAEEEFAALERKDNELAAKQAHSIKRAHTLKKECEKMVLEERSYMVAAEELAEKAKQLEIRVPETRQRVESLQETVDAIEVELQAEFEKIRSRKCASDQALQPQVIKLGELTARRDLVKAKIRLLHEHQDSVVAEKKRQREKIDLAESQLAQKSKEAQDLEKDRDRLKKRFTEKRDGLLGLRNTIGAEREKLQDIRATLEIKEVNLYKERNANMMVPRILEAKEEKRLEGVVDRLWNLATVPPECEEAVAAIAGSEFIVVEKTQHGQNVVEFVRNNHLGRVTCIVMDRIREELWNQMEMTKRRRIPKGAELLLNRVKPISPDYEIAFFFVLRDVLLVPTIDDARQIAFGGNERWKVVTLDGQVIDKAGTMTGGGSQGGCSKKTEIFRQRYHSKSSSGGDSAMQHVREVEKLKIEGREAEMAIDVAQKKKTVIEAELSDIEAQLNEMETHLARVIAEREASKKDLVHYTNTLAQCQIPELSADEVKNLKKLEKEAEECEKAFVRQESVVAEYQKCVDSIAKEIEMVGGGKRLQARQALAVAQQELEAMVKEMEETHVQVVVKKKKATQLASLVPKKEKDMQAELDAGKEHQKARDALMDKAEIVLRNKEELEKILVEQRQVENDKRKALSQLVEASKKSGLTEVSYQTRLQDLDHSLATVRHALQKHEKQLRKLEEDWKAVPVIDSEQKESFAFPLGHDESVTSASDSRSQNESENKKDVPSAAEAVDHCEGKTDSVIVPATIREGNVSEELPRWTEDVLDQLDEVVVSCEIKKLTESSLTAKVDLSVIGKHRVALQKLKELSVAFEETCQEREAQHRELERLKLARLQQFTAGFLVIAARVKEMYQMITREGDAELETLDPSAPFESGIIFSVRPPKKSWKQIQNLSGGEKTLSSLALVFALHYYRPTPIYFLDEIDAALDHRNVSTIALYIANQAKNAQFIIISLRNHMFELADRLVGIYKISGSTRTATIDPDSFVDEAEKGSLSGLERSGDTRRSLGPGASVDYVPRASIGSSSSVVVDFSIPL